MNASFVLQPGNPELEPRRGDPPLTTRPSRQQPFPHQQLTQTAPIGLQDELFARVLTLPGVSTGDSCVSVPGARAFILDPALAAGPAAAFQCETEFAHLHPPGDGSLHIALPPVWVPETRFTSADLLLRQRRSSGMIRRWRCG
jgi:phospholipase/carboxylesterase